MLTSIKGIGIKTLEKLGKLDIFNEFDLINFLPKNYTDLSLAEDIRSAKDGSFVFLKAQIISVNRPLIKGKLKINSYCVKTDSDKKLKVTFFNQGYIKDKLKDLEFYYFYGKLCLKSDLEIVNPEYEEAGKPLKKLHGIKVVYPLKGNIAQRTFSSIVASAIENMNIISVAKDTELKSLPSLLAAYKNVHFPLDLKDINLSKKRIAIENVSRYMLAYELVKGKEEKQTFKINKTYLSEFLRALPYNLTDSQESVLNNILIRNNTKITNSIITGDVGSGKTVIALLLSALIAKSSGQVAFMVPTEILAKQHYDYFVKTLENFNIRIGLLIAGGDLQAKKHLITDIKNHNVDIVIGTHAVISGKVEFNCLRLIIIDEQHKFGVHQRTKLIDKGIMASVLTLSATPIPRSLQLVIYRDIDFYTIENRFPKDNIITSIVMQNKRSEMFNYLKAECLKGSRAYIVAPRITDDEGYDLSSVDSLFSELKNDAFKDIEVGKIYGKISSVQKEKIISNFRKGDIKVLISTSLIEVGIDIREVDYMVIMNAENFGISSLHQLRGRVGRDGQKAYCFLYTEKTGKSYERLLEFKNENNGFKLAEKDYELRGGGNFLGEEQSGKNKLLGDITLDVIKEAKRLCALIDPFEVKEILEPYTKEIEFLKISKT